MDKAFAYNEAFAKEHGLLKTSVDNYVRRIWDIPNKNRGSAAYGFKTFSTSQLQRTLPTIADGIMPEIRNGKIINRKIFSYSFLYRYYSLLLNLV